MNSKKGIELSATFLVTLILTLLVFVFSVYFAFRIYTGGRELQKQLDIQTEEELKRLIIDENAIVAIYPSSGQTRIGEQKIFGIGIRNILKTTEPKEFKIVADFSGAYSPDGKINYCSNFDECRNFANQNWLGRFRIITLKIGPQRLEIAPMIIFTANRITTDIYTKKGMYYFNVCVFINEPDAPDECTTNERNIVYPQGLGRIQKVVVNVV